MNSNNIVLIGFMGSGKSTIARCLYQHTKKMVLDSDIIISNNENLDIKDIFLKYGEEYFRKLELEFCNFIKDNVKNSIISTGGGMPSVCNVKDIGKVFFLDLPFKEIENRLKDSKNRPLFSDTKKAKLLYEQRQEIYKSSCHFIINANKTPREITQEILQKI
ncbi:shikimate kinase [Helicobacter ibis]|uniref:Shikimate kinase n=1 Tax=Helicobacter ibis TaxID=2962633 RepID=A0ABT4VEB4_9HELI|nr:shikimate kinase [Helicobacter ibis]MDA3969015.1 shikimate kinase [Helicobacter ibis]